MKIESADQDIRTLLSAGYYKIPRFQRPYSWEHENIQDFWEDVIQDSSGDYFIGSMVVFKHGKQTFGVVDGQQRLTTITILLCVLRNHLEKLGFKNLANGVHGLVERRNIDNNPEFVLSTETSYPYFQDHIQKWGPPDVKVKPLQEEDNLKRAYEQLQELVAGVVESVLKDETIPEAKRKELASKKLTAVRDALLDLELVFIKLDDEDDAYIIFETLNTRGKDLSLSDLVKNHLTKHLRAKNSAIDQTKVKWKRILETVEGSSAEIDTDTFLHHFWLSKYDYLPAKKLFRILKKQVNKSQAKDFLNELVSDSEIYRSIHEASFRKWSKQESSIVETLDALTLFRVRQQTPCVLSLLREYNNGKLKMRHLEDALIAIEKFHFFFTAVTSQRSSGGISGMYAALARRFWEAVDTQAAVVIIKDLKTKLRDRVPSREEVAVLFPKIIYTDTVTKQRALVKYILCSFHKRHSHAVTVDYDHMTIEHLVPQSLIGSDGYDDLIIGQLGNLILVPEKLNAKLKNKAFKEKRKILVDAGVVLPQEIKKADHWTPKEISARTEGMVKVAYETIWKI